MNNIETDKQLIPIYIFLSELLLKVSKNLQPLNNYELEKINFILLNDIYYNKDNKIKDLIELITQLNHNLVESNINQVFLDDEQTKQQSLKTFLNHYIREVF